jgi:hypothetical protein
MQLPLWYHEHISNMFLQDINNLLKGYTVKHCSFSQLLSYIVTLFCLTIVTTHQLTYLIKLWYSMNNVSVRRGMSVNCRKTLQALSLYVVSKHMILTAVFIVTE